MRYLPEGIRLTSVCTPRPSRSKSSRSRWTPMRRARAIRWITALVDPPMAAKTRIAFSNASRARILERETFSFTSSTMRRPAMRAVHAGLRLVELVDRDLASTQILRHRPGVGPRPDVVAVIFAGEHRSAGDEDGGQIDAARTHERSGRSLVATGEKDHAVERI